MYGTLDPSGYVVFCDDIRQEVGNKLSYMGIYSGDMLFPQLPGVVQKLCVAMRFDTPVEDSPSMRTRVEIASADGVETILDIENGVLDIPTPNVADGQDQPTRRHVYQNFVLPSFLIQKPSTVRVIMIADGKEHVLGKLRISCISPQ